MSEENLDDATLNELNRQWNIILDQLEDQERARFGYSPINRQQYENCPEDCPPEVADRNQNANVNANDLLRADREVAQLTAALTPLPGTVAGEGSYFNTPYIQLAGSYPQRRPLSDPPLGSGLRLLARGNSRGRPLTSTGNRSLSRAPAQDNLNVTPIEMDPLSFRPVSAAAGTAAPSAPTSPVRTRSRGPPQFEANGLAAAERQGRDRNRLILHARRRLPSGTSIERIASGADRRSQQASSPQQPPISGNLAARAGSQDSIIRQIDSDINNLVLTRYNLSGSMPRNAFTQNTVSATPPGVQVNPLRVRTATELGAQIGRAHV